MDLLGIFTAENEKDIAVIIYREGLQKGLEGFMYDLDKSFKGYEEKYIKTKYNILLESTDPRVPLILVDLKEKYIKVKSKKYKEGIAKVIKIYSTKQEEEQEEELEIIRKGSRLFFDGIILDIDKINFYCEDNKYLILGEKSINLKKKLPKKVLEEIMKEESL